MNFLRSFKIAFISVFLLSLIAIPIGALAANPGDIVINEVSWSGTTASTSAEWIEFYNTTAFDIDIAGWSIYGADTGVCLNFSAADGSTTTVVPAGGYLVYANGTNNFSSGATEEIWDATIGLNDSSPGSLILY
ncbi:MAG: lamin tail domain-containing protein, partial [bacterium]|nr:lamin tail domain-containing protein [bacterium]